MTIRIARYLTPSMYQRTLSIDGPNGPPSDSGRWQHWLHIGPLMLGWTTRARLTLGGWR